MLRFTQHDIVLHGGWLQQQFADEWKQDDA
jgi:hypothetical protein